MHRRSSPRSVWSRWWVIRLGIRPIKQMTETASRDRRRRPLRTACPRRRPAPSPASWRGAEPDARPHRGALDERAASEERLRRFVADASHELRTPVTTIRGYAELYRRGGLGEPDALDEAMRRTEQEAVRMGRLVEDMLQLAKLDQERPLDVRAGRPRGAGRRRRADARAVAPRRDRSTSRSTLRRRRDGRRGPAAPGDRQRGRQRARAHRRRRADRGPRRAATADDVVARGRRTTARACRRRSPHA